MTHSSGADTSRNRLLASLTHEDFALLQPHLRPCPLPLQMPVSEPGASIDTGIFVETGLISYVSPTDVQTEVGVVGREGLVGFSVMLDVRSSPLRAMVQMPGDGLEMATGALLDATERSRSLRSTLLRFTHVFMMQAASTAYSNAHYTVEQRLARWLLMCHDRSTGDDLELTHEFLAMMLSVRRPGVTVATHVLEGNGLIRAKRGRITILDRGKLAALAGDSYGLAETEYERVLAP